MAKVQNDLQPRTAPAAFPGDASLRAGGYEVPAAGRQFILHNSRRIDRYVCILTRRAPVEALTLTAHLSPLTAHLSPSP